MPAQRGTLKLVLYKCKTIAIMNGKKDNFRLYFLYCCPECLSCPANAVQMDQATWAVWAIISNTALLNRRQPAHLKEKKPASIAMDN